MTFLKIKTFHHPQIATLKWIFEDQKKIERSKQNENFKILQRPKYDLG